MLIINGRKTTLSDIMIVGPGTALVPGLIIKDTAGNLDNGLFSSGEDALRMSINGIITWRFDALIFGNTNDTRSAFRNVTPSDTVPNILVQHSNINTGWGAIAVDNISGVCGGLEAVRFEDPADLVTTETSLWIYDDDNGAIGQVTVGIADSGGAGFKLLRIVN